MTLEANKSYLAPVWARYSDVLVERGQGPYIYAVDGQRYLDFTCGIGVTNTGHCHPRVVEAIREQAGLLLHGQANILYHKPMLQLVEALRQIVPAQLDHFFFSNSGAEIVEASLKLARQATGRSDVIAFSGGFHGRTYGAMALTSSKSKYRGGFAPLPSGVHIAPYAAPYAFAIERGLDPESSAEAAADYALRQLRHLLATQAYPDDVAAMIVEPVLGEGGYIVPPVSFLQGLRQICDEIGALLIIDEVQTGFGRTGKWFAHEYAQITPDILLMAKGIASGLPLSALAAKAEIMERWHPGSHGGTYGGNALACAAAVATIATIQEEGLVENAARQGELLRDLLRDLPGDTSMIGEVRGLGLMVGVELVQNGTQPNAALTKEVLARCQARGLLLLNCGPYDNVVRFIPPLVVNEEQIREAVEIFGASLHG